MSDRVRRDLSGSWRDPVALGRRMAHEDGAAILLSDGARPGARSWIALEPENVCIEHRTAGQLFAPLRQTSWSEGVVGLASYDAGARAATGKRPVVWPDLILIRYTALLEFDHDRRVVTAHGWGADADQADARARKALTWITDSATPASAAPPAAGWRAEASDDDYRGAVADTVRRIGAGEIFQANIAHAWSGALAPGADPADVFTRLNGAGAPADFSAFLRIGDRAIVSNSPELFVSTNGRQVTTRPIKGTAARHSDPAADAASAQALRDSAKDRAENLMIVDLMRNDLARVCEPGSVRVDRLFELETLPSVHHLVSTVTGRLAEHASADDILAATFPPGSITGAPKHQAMRVIANHEPPRGPWCGSLFLLQPGGDLTASVLIRTASFQKDGETWIYRTLAGAGIVADSDPDLELAETELKIAPMRRALTGD